MTRKSKTHSAPAERRWAALTWDDLGSWAGNRSLTRGRAYQRQGRVHDLAISPEGSLLATVTGSRSYTTSVWLTADPEDGEREQSTLRSRCTCPVGYNRCKHAVAVVTEYLQHWADDAEVAIAGAADPRWRLVETGDTEDQSPPAHAAGFDQSWHAKLCQHLANKSRDELIDLLASLIQRFPELHEEFTERVLMAEGDADHLLSEARRELASVTEQPGWSNPWDDEGWTPDYSRLGNRLERLIELGHPDAATKLGRELLDRGMAQVEQSDDEGETAEALEGCLAIVFEAVARSSLSPPEKLLFAIDAQLQDDYGITDSDVDIILAAEYSTTDWSEVADNLAQRLESMGDSVGRDFHAKFLRGHTADWLAHALAEAERSDEILAHYEREARITQSYQRLVRFLIDHDRYAEAESWAQEGIEATRDSLPGISAGLTTMMSEVAQLRGREDIVASHAAQKFFARPSRQTYEELIAAAGKIHDQTVQQQVQQTARNFLKTGEAPVRLTEAKNQARKLTVDSDWPLPVPDDLAASLRPRGAFPPKGPHYDVLLEIALAEQRLDDVLHWYAQLQTRRAASRNPIHPGTSYADRVATAIASTYPQKALAIYRQCLDALLPTASPTAYETCAYYLRQMRPIMQSLGREDEWHQLLAEIRAEYRRRPRFMEVLDRLDGATIVQTQRNRRNK